MTTVAPARSSAAAAHAPVVDVKTVAEIATQPPEYRVAVEKIVVSHAVNELHGAQVFDEPAIRLAPTPYAKWLTCRVAMEEYHHHVRFKGLADELGIAPERLDPAVKKPLSIFEFDLRTWAEFCVIKAVADYAEVLQVEDLLHCSFHPLRNLARLTMPEEKFHAKFGRDFCQELVDAGRGDEVQAALERYMPITPAFFGAAGSKNNEMFRRFGLKQRSNEEMRADFLVRVTELVEKDLGLKMPALPALPAVH
ncbi:MAG: phenylacetate-CoA oxygenase subunit PaaI [Burkholderiales bacterium]|jgi:ring-1,2-phenylacetyl-CoA epoxidase subunit PaaA|nr:phenylacetate-CoA oxygenase subunit PaaI [Burkholderiales bacterium]